MNTKEIKRIIELHKMLNAFSSLPFLVDTQDGLKVCWFNYEISEHRDKITMRVRDIFMLKTQEILLHRKVDLTVETSCVGSAYPELEESEYLCRLEKLSECWNRNEMSTLISKAEPDPIVQAYQRVETFCKTVFLHKKKKGLN